MKNVIVGTAGHVDHGKTCLIKALTGIDTDRLKEEKKRGITIENGFADMICGDYNISIIDVPGHERFIPNMLAGIGGIDLVLLVIALDEGVMPQTIEHLHILSMLGIRRGIIVYTKRDMVEDEDWIELVKEDTASRIEGTFLEDAPSIEVSAYTGLNIDALKDLIVSRIDESILKNDAQELFRMPIDRVFTIEGSGTVVTGTLIEGTIRTGDEVQIYPGEKTARVRGIQVHNQPVEAAFAGQRTAVNLMGMKTSELSRGDVIAYKGSLEPSGKLDVRLEVFEDSPYQVEHSSRVHFYAGAAELIGKVQLLDRDVLEPGSWCYAQILFDEPIAVKRNDRFIIRFYSPMVTIGGGLILDGMPRRHKRRRKPVLDALALRDGGSDQEVALQILAENVQDLLNNDELARRLCRSRSETAAIVKKMAKDKQIYILKGDYLIAASSLQEIREGIEAILGRYHQDNALSPGMQLEELKSRLLKEYHISDSRMVEGILDALAGKKVVRISNGIAALSSHKILSTPAFEEMKNRIITTYKEAGFEMPDIDKVLAAEYDKKNAMHFIDTLAREGKLVKITSQYFLDGECYQYAVDQVKTGIQKNGTITLAEVRDIIHSSRKYTQMLLEYMDKKRITKLVGESRILL